MAIIFEECSYISRISRNENFCEDCTREVATQVHGVFFLLILQKINSTNRSNFEICEIYTP